ncbi:ferritin-like domain-containing protein [Nocardia bovistercoris]|uniref:Ferritin-like domain-containing protein n=1 Tax=Nocardia bovistercoris TaxID=2785916 RepID=A0A931I710_9NOCA|nr:ferritin-like domain-containing protein [Nocardia bovistercoris]MBH0775231.1 ferritin-like domain-containing protein [Nocardia bovistercoris]
MTDAEHRAVLDALGAEYAAVYAYGVIAAYASTERTRLVAEYTAAHRARRDATVAALTAAGVPVPAPEPAYTAPFPVDDPIPAANLAVTVENDAAIAWRAVVEQAVSEATRGLGVEALTDSALRLATWQAILGTPTFALPGRA